MVPYADSLLDRISAKGVGDMEDGCFRHAGMMPNNLASRKPNVSGVRQGAWRDIIRPMPKAPVVTPYTDIAERLRWHREEVEQLTQTDYAKRAGLTRAQYSNWEGGIYRLSIDGAMALRHTYGLSLDFMYLGSADALPMTLRRAWLDSPAVKASK